jgi:hypothetical protein
MKEHQFPRGLREEGDEALEPDHTPPRGIPVRIRTATVECNGICCCLEPAPALEHPERIAPDLRCLCGGRIIAVHGNQGHGNQGHGNQG